MCAPSAVTDSGKTAIRKRKQRPVSRLLSVYRYRRTVLYALLCLGVASRRRCARLSDCLHRLSRLSPRLYAFRSRERQESAGPGPSSTLHILVDVSLVCSSASIAASHTLMLHSTSHNHNHAHITSDITSHHKPGVARDTHHSTNDAAHAVLCSLAARSFVLEHDVPIALTIPFNSKHARHADRCALVSSARGRASGHARGTARLR